MDAELDLEDLPPKTLRKMLRSIMAKMNRKPGDKVDPKDEEKSEKEREDLADLHEEKKGNVPKQPVDEDDLPFEVDGDAEGPSEADEEAPDDEGAEKKQFPPKKKKK